MGELYERVWPVDDAKGAVVIVHGLAEHSGRYDHVARALNAKGYAVYAQDLRGHGHSVGFPGDMGGDAARVESDIVEHCVRVRAAHDRVFLLAHSMGTLYSMPAAARMPDGTIRSLILSGVAIEPGQAALESAGSGGLPPETICRDPAVVQAYIDDPLVFEKIPDALTLMLLEQIPKATAAVGGITVPLLLLHGGDDQLCSISGANYVWVQSIVTDKVLQGYPGLYHEVLNEPEKETVINDLVTWIEAH